MLSNTYAPNNDDHEFFSKWFAQISRFNPKFLILGGDFNLVMDVNCDKQGGRAHTHDKARDVVLTYRDSMNLLDIWRELNPDKFEFTWRTLRPQPIFVRLDFFLVSDTIAPFIINATIKPGFKTDHSAVILEIDLAIAPKGPRFWKLNNSLLHNRNYIDGMNKLLDIELSQNYVSKRQHWEVIKLTAWGSTIQFAARKKKAKNNELIALQRKLGGIHKKLPNLPTILLESADAQAQRIQHDINVIMTEHAKGAIVRSRSKWQFLAERPTKYFLNLEKQNFCKKTIYRLKTEQGEIITDPNEILKAQNEYYKKLYTSQGETDLSYLNDVELPKVSNSCKESLNNIISSWEISKAIQKMKNNRCPGVDGFPIEWYKMFYPKLKDFLHDLYAEIVDENEFHLTTRQGLISLFEKIGRDILLLKSWRPLTLLNVDHKIYSKILAMRLHDALDSIVHESQTGFLAGRYIAENIMKMFNLIEMCNKFKKSAIVISLDYEKAFDKIEWPAVYRTLESFDMGENFIRMIRILYNKPITTTINNGFWSEWFSPTRGNRQGDPISTLLFVAVAEVLNIKLRTNVKIRGIEMNYAEILNCHYADDLWLALEPTEENLNNVIEELEHFSAFSGLTINYEKSVAFTLGPLRDSDVKFYSMKKLFWSDGPVRILGIDIHPDWNIVQQLNYFDTLKKVRNILHTWSNRTLTPLGKITVINSLVSSMFVYKFMALPTPDKRFFTEYKHIISEFLWDGKRAKIRYERLVQPYEKMGLKLVDLECKDLALKAAWIKRWSNKNRLNNIPWLYINLPVKDSRIWECNLKGNDVDKLCPYPLDMGAQILKAWTKWHYTEEFSAKMFHTVPIWANSMLCRVNKPFIHEKLLLSNINTIDDIWNYARNDFMTYNELTLTQGSTIDFLLYNAIITAMPKIWRQLARFIDKNEVPQSNVEIIMTYKNASKQLYWDLLEAKFPTSSATCTLWAHNLNMEVCLLEDIWESLYLKTCSFTNATKLRWFQLRVLNRILTTNILRSRYHNHVSSLCSFCASKNETVTHLLYECDIVKQLWFALVKWIKYYSNIDIKIDLSLVVLNNYKGSANKLINMYILALKQYIYSSKCKEKIPTFSEFVRELDALYFIEKAAAFESSHGRQFFSKWKTYHNN